MTAAADEHSVDHAPGGAHIPDAQYVKIALILAVVTAIEVGLYYVDIGATNNLALVVLAAIKFAVVALYFMHLRWDNRILRRLFVGGVILAGFCYFGVMFMFRLFW